MHVRRYTDHHIMCNIVAIRPCFIYPQQNLNTIVMQPFMHQIKIKKNMKHDHDILDAIS